MSLEIAAKHLASKGRGPDTQLVHMSLGELSSLQELAKAHGGTLSINPETGLPEAGFLDSLLPAIIGGGLMFATGGLGAAAMPGLFGLGMPATIGLGVGALQTARTGDIGKGLMAGLGAYGGAGLGAGLLGAGGAAASPAAAGTSALDVMGQPLTGTAQAAGQGFGANLSQAGQGISNLASESGRAGFMQGVGGGKGLLKYAAGAAAPMLMAGESESAPPQLDSQRALFAFNPGRVKNPESLYPADYRGELMNFQPQYTRLAAGGGLLDRGTGGSTDDNKYTYDPLTQSYKKVEPPKPTTATGMGSDRTMDSGGAGGDLAAAGPSSNDFGMGAIGFGQGLADLGLTGLGNAIAGPGINALGAAESAAAQASADHAANAAANEAGISAAFGNADSTSDSGAIGAGDGGGGIGAGDGLAYGGLAAMARGGYSHLGDYSDGGRLLRGPGDGVSDSIPATIGNKRPARLADGEFVIPARIVSELGNGSTEAGARKLYAMMNRVQAARGQTTGKGRVAKNTRADKYLPA
jgi:hypothetical protein